MRKIIMGLAVSLDGFIEGPNGEFDWCYTDQDYGMSDFFKKIDSVFIGRKSYEVAQAMGDAATAGFPKLNEYIFSTTLDTVKDGAILIKKNVREEIEKIRNEKGKDIWLFGGAKLITSLLKLGLVDELWLSVHPIILGAGKPLFSDISERIHLKLIHCQTYSTGLVSLTYHLK
jgi:dihydrofolate reductase